MKAMWQLPEGMDGLVGESAIKLEYSRRVLLDFYQTKEFQYVIPPIAEYVESLLLNTSETLDLKTFKVIDQNNGKMLGIHADITPQIARIDAQYTQNNKQSINRYCYINSILQTKADGFYTDRTPIQAGCEIYGDETINADIEMIELMLSSMDCLKISDLTLNLADKNIFYTLIKDENLAMADTLELESIFKCKSKQQLSDFLKTRPLKNGDTLLALIDLNGGVDVIEKSLKIFKNQTVILDILTKLTKISQALKGKCANIHIDLAQISGYEYHSGLLFSLYQPSYEKAIAQGGRYDELSTNFGRSRFATGFSFDLKTLIINK
jgi:ATP phosphoribosyltransferase regulatory subunit